MATPLPRPSVPSARTMVDDLPRGAGVGAGTIAIVFLLAAAIAGALVFGRSWFERKRAGRAADRVAVRLNVLPDDAAVRLDGQPLAGRQMELPLGSSHTLDVSAPGRIARHRAFTVTDVGTLALRLPHALGDFAPDDPPASPAELQHPPPGARDATAIDNAWRKLQRIEPCLGSEPPLSCAAELAAARDASPDAPALDAAIGELAAAFGDASVVPADLRARARAELLAERAVWEEAELDQIERDDGRYAGWHLRRVALAARALVRALSSPSAAEPLRKQRLAAFDAARAALRDHENHYPDDVKGTPGAEPFAAAADALAALARRAPRGKKAGSPPDPSVLLDSYGKLIAALNSAVLR